MIEKTKVDLLSIKDKVENIKDFDHDIIEVLAKDKHDPTAEEIEKIESLKKTKEESFYRDLLFSCVGVKLSEPEAKERWAQILKHKFILGTKLERNVGFRVAAVDYLTNVTHELAKFNVIEKDEFRQAAKATFKDGLTRLYNRTYFHDYITTELNARQQSKIPFSLLIFDIDFFKNYNDINGHMAGDIVLIELSKIIKLFAAGQGMAARYGGEEFVIIFNSLDKQPAFHQSQCLREIIEEHQIPNEEALPGKKLTISGGVSSFPEDANSIEALIDIADKCLYRAKESGRNCIETNWT